MTPFKSAIKEYHKVTYYMSLFPDVVLSVGFQLQGALTVGSRKARS